MKNQNLNKIEVGNLENKLSAIDEEFKEFKGFMSTLTFKKDVGAEKLTTFSPLDAVADFEQNGIHAVAEPTRDEMLANDNAFNKLLANMLQQCQPGALSDEDITQISGINGREVRSGL